MNMFGRYNKIEHGSLKRLDLKSPTDKDIKDTIKLFRDFEISVDIPEFKTKGELYNWRDRVIRGIWNE